MNIGICLEIRISMRNAQYPDLHRDGFPHSEIAGSSVVGTSPAGFAAFCVLHRLLPPRHSPFTLLLNFFFRLDLSHEKLQTVHPVDNLNLKLSYLP